MKIRTMMVLLLATAFGLFFVTSAVQADQSSIKEQAQQIAQKYVLTDTHVDVPYRLEAGWVDVTRATGDGDFDLEFVLRYIAGGQ